MIDTYSVIIQNKKTAESFSKFEPLFMEVLNNNRIGVCKWIESGTTIDTAVPELRDLTNDKEAWCAVIVRFEDEASMSNFKSDKRNPYDFVENQSKNGEVSESEIPLIRLTHMLGGIPAPEMKFVCEQVYEEGKAPRTIYKPVEDLAQKQLHKSLSEKYKFDGVAPSMIMIISIREDYDEQGNIDIAWKHSRESNSSDFWKRNQYPSICRFLVYDFERKGPVQRDADEFGFWLSIMLLSSNKVDPGALQAYRLYNLKTKTNKKLMEETFQKSVDSLKTARKIIEKSIRRETEQQLEVETELPDYRLEVPVTIRIPKKEQREIDLAKFKLLSNGVNSDFAIWEQGKKDAEEWIDSSIRIAERTLDQTASKMKDSCTFEEYEVTALDRYQEEDMIRETGEIYRDIIELQGKLPMNMETQEPELEEAVNKIEEFLRGRIIGETALSGLCIAFGMILLGQATAIMNYASNHVGSIGQILAVICVETIIVVIAAFIVLALQKGKINDLVDRYNELMSNSYNRLTGNAGDFSRYLSNIASHSRGYSYLNWSKGKKNHKENVSHSKYVHIKAINQFLGKLKAWSVAYHLNVHFNENDWNEQVVVDTSVVPSKNALYTFELGNQYPINVNNSGETIDSPFNFVEQLEILREELYDDDDENN